LARKRQVIAFDAADHAAAEILDVGHVGHQRIVDARLQQVGSGQLAVELVAQLIDQLVDRPGGLVWI
jgi:hypothetical protein